MLEALYIQDSHRNLENQIFIFHLKLLRQVFQLSAINWCLVKKPILLSLQVQRRNVVEADSHNHGEQHYPNALSSENYNYIKYLYILVFVIVANTNSSLADTGLLIIVFLQVQ